MSAATESRDEAMAAVEGKANRADPYWSAHAQVALHTFALFREGFAGFQFVEWYRDKGYPMPHDDRAFGPIIMRAIRAGWFEKTTTYIPHPKRHATGTVVYKSLLY